MNELFMHISGLSDALFTNVAFSGPVAIKVRRVPF